MSEDGKLKRFGRYLLLDRLVDGGMANIYRARFLREDADKIVAIKMIRSQFSENQEFKKMFSNEIKLTFGLSHPCIAQAYDYGLQDEKFFIAMEFVDGKNLRQFSNRLKEKNRIFPVEFSTHIAAQVCQGLYYAHNFQNKFSGKNINIIHRDISPHNIMLTFDGGVKIIDFGIAKTDAKTDHTDTDYTKAGVIKGKLSYIAPEYLEGVELDHRYDQFSLGTTLWELLCSQKLFNDTNELAILKQIQACKVSPPSHINPNVPEELDKIVMKALNKDKKLRFSTMDEFGRALTKFLHACYPNFTSSDISQFAKTLFKNDIKKDREKFFEFGKINIQPYIEDWKNELKENNDPSHKLRRRGTHSFHYNVIDLGSENVSLGKLKLAKVNESDKNHTAAINSSITPYLKYGGEEEEAEEKKTRLTANSLKILAFVAVVLGLIYSTRKTLLEQPIIKKYALALIPSLYQSTQRTDRSPASTFGMGRLTLAGFKSHHQLFVNGISTPYDLFFVKLPLAKRYTIKVTQEGKSSFIRRFYFAKKNPEITYRIPELARESIGEIYVLPTKSIPKGSILEFKVEGERVTQRLPLRQYRLPTGIYDGTIKNTKLGIKKNIKFTVREDKRTEILVQ